MNDEGQQVALGVFGALLVAALMLGGIWLQNWFAHGVVQKALTQPAPAFPTTQISAPLWLTPFAVMTPFSLGLNTFATPTPHKGDSVYITTR